MLKPWLTTTEQRAKDLQTTLANFDGRNLARPDGKDAVLTAFQKLSKQCSLLERQSDQNSSIMLERHFAVLFDEPIGDACGLRIEDLDGIDDGVTGTAALIDCDLSVLESRKITAEGFAEE